MSLISCKDLAFAYDGVTVLRHLNFKVEQGDYLCILGENGAGKSTLMKGLLGLKKPSAGIVTFGEDLRAREIGYLPQQTPVQKDFPASVREVVLSGCLSGMGMRPFYGKEEKGSGRPQHAGARDHGPEGQMLQRSLRRAAAKGSFGESAVRHGEGDPSG